MFLLQIISISLALVGLKSSEVKYSVTTVNGQPVLAGAMIFEEHFDHLDTSVWKHDRTMSGGGNWEFQMYDNNRTNSFTKNGILHIKPTLTEERYGNGFVTSGILELNGYGPAQCTDWSTFGCVRSGSDGAINPVISASIRTIDSFSFKYGRVEVRAKMPVGDWLWPAIWMMPRHNQYGGWPASGEIDLVESRGNSRLIQTVNKEKINIGVEQVGSTLHWGPSGNFDRYSKTSWTRNNAAGYNSAFHLYQLEWTPNFMKFSIDNSPLAIITPHAGGLWHFGNFSTHMENPWRNGAKMAPFDQEFYFIINLAVGGVNEYFPSTAKNEGGAARPWSPTSKNALLDFWKGKSSWYPTWQTGNDTSSLQVDYVKYQYKQRKIPDSVLLAIELYQGLEEQPIVISLTRVSVTVENKYKLLLAF